MKKDQKNVFQGLTPLIKSHTFFSVLVSLYEICVTFNNIINVITCLSISIASCATVNLKLIDSE